MITFFKGAALPVPIPPSAIQSPVGEVAVDPSTGLLGPPAPVLGFKYEKVTTGYMDDPLNTDNAWKEMELWHLHYTDGDCLSDSMVSTHIHWRILTEDVFTKLPTSQAQLIHDLTHKLKPTIL